MAMDNTSDGERRRLDVELVRRGLAPTRTQAREAIVAGKVTVDGAVAVKPGQPVSQACRIAAAPAHNWVSRGGVKLDHALTVFAIDPLGQHCLDVGASTGGFTDVLLARGARRVVAVDVGTGQLHPRLQADPRVVSVEATDARTLDQRMVIEPPTLIVCDASFISLAKLLARPLSLAAARARLVGLFKPQFEVGAGNIGKRGIVSDQGAVAAARAELARWLQAEGWPVEKWTDSPITGGDGNRELLFTAVNYR